MRCGTDFSCWASISSYPLKTEIDKALCFNRRHQFNHVLSAITLITDWKINLMLYPKRFHEYSTCCQGQIWYLIEIRHLIVNFIVSRFSILHQGSSVQVDAKSAFRKIRQSLYELYCRHAARQKTNGLSQVYYPTMPTLAAGEGGQTP